MVTQGANGGGSNMNRGKSNNYQGKRAGGYGDSRRDDSRRDDRRRDDSRGSRPPRFEKSDNRNGASKPYNKQDRFDKNKSYGNGPRFSGKDKDDDEEDNSRRSKPQRPKENKPSAAIPDKNKVQLRLEKEQKSMKKKQQTKKKDSTRPQPKVKRSNNVNYIRNYANGDYDDYEAYDEYGEY